MSAPSTNYELKSELARWSLISKRSQADRRLAWVNSICVLFLFIGVVGARTREPIPQVPAPLEEAAPVIFEPAPPPPTEAEKAPEQTQPETAPAPVVVVVPNAPSVNFSIPTVGALVAPSSLSQAPPAHEMRERAVASAAPSTIGNTGKFGDRPEIGYPEIARQRGDQGTVVLLITADPDGRILSVDLKKSSGSGILDRAAREFIRLHWKMPTSPTQHQFEVPVTFLLRAQ